MAAAEGTGSHPWSEQRTISPAASARVCTVLRLVHRWEVHIPIHLLPRRVAPILWYDPCAFSIQPAGFIGTEPRNFLRGPGLTNVDFSIVKDTAIQAAG